MIRDVDEGFSAPQRQACLQTLDRLTRVCGLHSGGERTSQVRVRDEYLDLARIYQVLLSIGLFVWVFMLWRVMRRRLAGEHRGNMPWLFFLAALAIPAFYAVGLIARTGDHFTVTPCVPSAWDRFVIEWRTFVHLSDLVTNTVQLQIEETRPGEQECGCGRADDEHDVKRHGER